MINFATDEKPRHAYHFTDPCIAHSYTAKAVPARPPVSADRKGLLRRRVIILLNKIVTDFDKTELLTQEIFQFTTLLGIQINNEYQRHTKLKSLGLVVGIYYAFKSEKTRKNGVKIMSLIEKDTVLTTKEAIQYLRISKPTYLKYIRLGRIRAVKAGNGWRVHLSELHRFLKIEET